MAGWLDNFVFELRRQCADTALGRAFKSRLASEEFLLCGLFESLWTDRIPSVHVLSPIERHERRTNDYSSDASLRSGPKKPDRGTNAACSSISDNAE
jgi:hypothetical protein